MLNLKYSLVIEATEDPHFFAFYSPDLQGFTGSGKSIEDSLDKARIGMEDHLALMKERKLPIPSANLNPTVTIKDSRPVRQGA
jgi:predicted RNase H-like HicB family nuclease